MFFPAGGFVGVGPVAVAVAVDVFVGVVPLVVAVAVAVAVGVVPPPPPHAVPGPQGWPLPAGPLLVHGSLPDVQKADV
jgi:hypothetical protein